METTREIIAIKKMLELGIPFNIPIPSKLIDKWQVEVLERMLANINPNVRRKTGKYHTYTQARNSLIRKRL